MQATNHKDMSQSSVVVGWVFIVANSLLLIAGAVVFFLLFGLGYAACAWEPLLILGGLGLFLGVLIIVLALLGINLLAGALSGGEQQMLAMARALMSDPSVIILDEPSLGLAPKVVTEIMSALGHLRDEKGLAVLLVEQNVRAAFKIADRVLVMDRGRVVAEGTPAELASDERVRAAYLGGSSTSSSGVAAPVTRSGGTSA